MMDFFVRGWFYCVLLALAAQEVSAEVEELYRCPDHLQDYVGQHLVHTYNGRCFEFFDAEKRWVDARRYCEQIAHGGHLIHIPDAATMNWVKSTLYSLPWSNNGVWNSANDRSHEGTWEWLSGLHLSSSYSYWASGQPNKGFFKGRNDCAVMKRGDGWRWRDVSCDSTFYKYKFVCEFDMKPATTSLTTSTTTSSTTSTTTSLTTSLTTSVTTSVNTTDGLGAIAAVGGSVARPTKNRGLNVAWVAGIMGGLVLLILLLILVVALYSRRQPKKHKDSGTQMDGELGAQENPVYYERSSDSVFMSQSSYDDVQPPDIDTRDIGVFTVGTSQGNLPSILPSQESLYGKGGIKPPPYHEKDPQLALSPVDFDDDVGQATGVSGLNPAYEAFDDVSDQKKPLALSTNEQGGSSAPTNQRAPNTSLSDRSNSSLEGHGLYAVIRARNAAANQNASTAEVTNQNASNNLAEYSEITVERPHRVNTESQYDYLPPSRPVEQ